MPISQDTNYQNTLLDNYIRNTAMTKTNLRNVVGGGKNQRINKVVSPVTAWLKDWYLKTQNNTHRNYQPQEEYIRSNSNTSNSRSILCTQPYSEL